MKNSHIIGMVWGSIIVCLLSFGITVSFINNSSKDKQNANLMENEFEDIQKTAYITNESSIRTNNFANFNNEESKIRTEKESKELENKKNNINKEINDEIISDTEYDLIYENGEAIESIAKNTLSFIRPVKGDVLNPLSVDELVYSKTLKEWNIHNGIDYKAQLGDEVYSVKDGRIKAIKSDYIYGNLILIDHGDGYESLYSNITVLDALCVGDTLRQGQLIGYVAESYGFEVAEETHLHFELTKNGEYLSL